MLSINFIEAKVFWRLSRLRPGLEAGQKELRQRLTGQQVNSGHSLLTRVFHRIHEVGGNELLMMGGSRLNKESKPVHVNIEFPVNF